MLRKIFYGATVFLAGFLVFGIAFGVYFLTTSKYIQSGDSTEMVTAAFSLGIPHQPGYPLNTLIGHFFSKMDYFGLGTVQRINLASAFLQALTVFVFYFLMLELFPKSKLNTVERIIAAFSASMVLAFSLTFWQYATKFEVFPLNNLFAVLILLIALKISPLSDISSSVSHKLLGLLFLSFLLGLAVTHHQTIVLVFPTLIIIFWPLLSGFVKSLKGLDTFRKDRVRKLGLVGGISAVSALLGILVYFYLILNFAKADHLMAGRSIGNIAGAFSTLMRTEYGVFSPYRTLENAVRVNYPLDQITYYLRSIWADFSIYGVVFIIVGFVNLLKNNRRLFFSLITGVIVSGFMFLAYANFPLNDSFNQATVRRFYMLPNIFLAIFAGMGLYSLLSFLSTLREKSKSHTGNFLVFGVIIIGISIVNLYLNFSKANIREDNLTQLFIEKSYGNIPDGSLVLVSGDIQNMTGEFYHAYLSPETKTMIFTPGRFFLKWYLLGLLAKYKDLSLPPPEEGNMFTTTTQIVNANYGKFPIYISSELLQKDPNLQKDYTLYPNNLFFEVKRKGEEIKLEDFREGNKNLYDSLDLNLFKKVKSRSPNFEETIIYYFARYFYESGFVYSNVGLWEDAITEYQRSLNLEPLLADNYLGLAGAYANKEDPDYVSAINYLSQYQNMIYSIDPDSAFKLQETMEEYQRKYNEDYKKELEKQKLEATQSAEMRSASGEGELKE